MLVRIEAVGVNRYDVNQRSGGAKSLPAILGGDAGGTRADTGDRVVVAGARRGCYAELATPSEANVFPIPDAVSAPVASCLGTPYQLAWRIAQVGGIESGRRLLVQAGSSSTGSAVVDLAQALGATVFATASPPKLDRLEALGIEAFAYGDPRLAGLEADVVYDPVGAETFASSLAALARGGTILVPGAIDGASFSLDAWTLSTKRARIVGVSNAAAPEPETMRLLIEMVADGRLRPLVDRELPLEQAAEAHRAIEARETFGKVVLRV